MIVMTAAMGGVGGEIVQRDIRRAIGHELPPGVRQFAERLRAAGGQGQNESPSRDGAQRSSGRAGR